MNPINPHPQVRVSIAFITPQLAAQMLGLNTESQRRVAKINLGKIAEDMTHGRFHFNGESLIKGRSGRVLDGQHRLLSSVKSNVGFWTVLVEGIDDSLFATIDAGKSRSLPDTLTIAGEKAVNALAATLLRLAEYLRDPRSVCSNAGRPVSYGEAMDVLASCPSVRESLAACYAVKDVISPSRAAWLHYVTHDACPHLAEQFFAQLAKGEMIAASSPVYLLRARLIADSQSKARLSSREIQALLIKAWNMFSENRPVKQLKWAEHEEFPLLMLPAQNVTSAA